MVVMAAFVSLTPMAYASPPDPGYIAGFWDDGDYDDVVILVAALSSITESRAPSVPWLELVVLTTVCPVNDQLLSSGPLSSRSSRAPPTL
jgi:hypothetical protein